MDAQHQALKELKLQITGMTCAACATRIEKGLNKLEGVSQATVNLALENSTITYAPEKITVDELEQKVAGAAMAFSSVSVVLNAL